MCFLVECVCFSYRLGFEIFISNLFSKQKILHVSFCIVVRRCFLFYLSKYTRYGFKIFQKIYGISLVFYAM